MACLYWVSLGLLGQSCQKLSPQRSEYYYAAIAAFAYRASRNHLQCGNQCLRKGHATAESLAALRANAASRPPAKRDLLQRLDQCLRKGMLPPRALQFRESVIRQGLLPDVIIYNAWISACKRARHCREPCSSESQSYAKASCQT